MGEKVPGRNISLVSYGIVVLSLCFALKGNAKEPVPSKLTQTNIMQIMKGPNTIREDTIRMKYGEINIDSIRKYIQTGGIEKILVGGEMNEDESIQAVQLYIEGIPGYTKLQEVWFFDDANNRSIGKYQRTDSKEYFCNSGSVIINIGRIERNRNILMKNATLYKNIDFSTATKENFMEAVLLQELGGKYIDPIVEQTEKEYITEKESLQQSEAGKIYLLFRLDQIIYSICYKELTGRDRISGGYKKMYQSYGNAVIKTLSEDPAYITAIQIIKNKLSDQKSDYFGPGVFNEDVYTKEVHTLFGKILTEEKIATIIQNYIESE